MPTARTDPGRKPWHTQITLDLLVEILTSSLGHPAIAWLLPVCVRAAAAPYTSGAFISACAWAGLVTLARVAAVVDRRVADGVPREVDWDDEVVVVTGGSGGLGRILAQTYGMRGASVAVLDVVEPAAKEEVEGLAGVEYYKCDVGDAAMVGRVKKQIEKDLGTPTILINNAGIVIGKPIWDLSPADVRRSLDVNLLAHFNTISAFLPGMLSSETGGTIVTVASVLGKLGASYLSDYTAAKAGLIAMHTSLRAELRCKSAPEGAENIRAILVTPGQLSTPLFGDLETPSNFLGRVVEPVELAREIVKMIDSGMSGEISLPLYARLIQWLHVLPGSLQKLVRALSGIDSAMEKASLGRNRERPVIVQPVKT